MSTPSPAPLDVAIWQAPGLSGAPTAMLDRLEALLESGALAGADLLVLPELWTCGYFDRDAVTACAEPRNGPVAARLAVLGRAHSIAIAWGNAEQETTAGPIWNAATLVGPDGEELLHYRKVNLWDRYEQDLFTPGIAPSGVAVLNGWRLGFSVCYDTEFPETIRDLAHKGVDLVLAPTALGQEFALVGDALLRTRAFENGLYLAFANRSSTEHGYPFGGGSALIGPDGTLAAQATAETALVRATLHKERIEAARLRTPYLSELRWAAPRLR